MDNKTDQLLLVDVKPSKNATRDRKVNQAVATKILDVQVHPLQPHIVAVISSRGLTIRANPQPGIFTVLIPGTGAFRARISYV